MKIDPTHHTNRSMELWKQHLQQQQHPTRPQQDTIAGNSATNATRTAIHNAITIRPSTPTTPETITPTPTSDNTNNNPTHTPHQDMFHTTNTPTTRGRRLDQHA